MAHHHEIRVRYGEVDLQGVVFNAHYLAYVDDTMTAWMRAVGFAYPHEGLGFDVMVRHAEVDFVGGAGFDEVVEIEADVERWGTTSFTVRYDLHVGERAVATIRLVYVGVRLGTTDTMPVPDTFRAALTGS